MHKNHDNDVGDNKEVAKRWKRRVDGSASALTV